MSVTRDYIEQYFSKQKTTKEPSEKMKFIIKNKEQFLINKASYETFSIESGIFWAKNCFKFMETSIVTDTEIEWMQNCYAKSMELKFRFDNAFNKSNLE